MAGHGRGIWAVAWVLWSASVALPAAADFKEGLIAYNRGHYGAALREFRPLADAGDVKAQFLIGKMHARGPVGAEQLTSFKYLVVGNGTTRP